MKISKIPGLGKYGIYIDDLDFNSLSDDDWLELGQLHLESLVTIIRDVNLTPKTYEERIKKWGNPRATSDYRVKKLLLSDKEKLEEAKLIKNRVHNLHANDEVGGETTIVRVTGMRDKKGNPLGMFAEGELLWHSNESGNLIFAAGVSLLGGKGMTGSSTGFCVTADWYEDQSESFRSELNELICYHEFRPGRINPGLRNDQDEIMRENMCPEPTELPLVIQSPLGIIGLHYSVNTITGIKGMSFTDSEKLFQKINQDLFSEKYTYDHWYQQDNDLLLFDNSITLHRRLGETKNRLAYRIQYDYGRIAPKNFNPYLQDPWKTEYYDTLDDMKKVLGI